MDEQGKQHSFCSIGIPPGEDPPAEDAELASKDGQAMRGVSVHDGVVVLSLHSLQEGHVQIRLGRDGSISHPVNVHPHPQSARNGKCCGA